MTNTRVVILSAFLTPFRSGAEACAEEVAMRLSDRFDITIVTAKLRGGLPRTDMLQGKVPVIRVGLGCSFDKWLYPLLAPLAARKLKPDVIHAVLETFAGLALLVTRWTGPRAKRILTLQTTNRNFLRGLIIRSADTVTAISSVLVSQAKSHGCDPVLIPNGIPLKEIGAAVQSHKKAPLRLLFVGRLEKMKGVDTMLHAFSLLPSPSPVPSPHLHIVGSGSQDAALKTLARELHVDDRVTFLGRLSGPDLFREYAEAEIFCGLSRSEALGNVFLEAAAARCAVVATNVGGIPDIVQDGITGLLVPPDDHVAATHALHRLLTDVLTRCAMADAGAKQAASYDWSAIAERYAALYGA